MNAQYTFDTFIPGPNNASAFSHIRAAAAAPGMAAQNPIFLYGPASSGKTHLLHAMGNSLLQQGFRNVICITLEAFLSELISAIHQGTLLRNSPRYTSAEALLIDDIHMLLDKEATQNELFFLINQFLRAGKPVMLTSCLPLEDYLPLQELLPFQEIRLSLPEAEERLTIARQRAAMLHVEVSEAVLYYLSARADNVRQIEGGLKRILAYQELLSPGMTTGQILEMLSEQWLPAIRRTPD